MLSLQASSVTSGHGPNNPMFVETNNPMFVVDCACRFLWRFSPCPLVAPEPRKLVWGRCIGRNGGISRKQQLRIRLTVGKCLDCKLGALGRQTQEDIRTREAIENLQLFAECCGGRSHRSHREGCKLGASCVKCCRAWAGPRPYALSPWRVVSHAISLWRLCRGRSSVTEPRSAFRCGPFQMGRCRGRHCYHQ